MNICFITHDIAHIGGQERVLTLVANMLVEKEINVTILVTSNKKEDMKKAYPLNPEVQLISDSRMAKGKCADLHYKMIRTWNKKIHRIKNLEILKKIYFPHSERMAYEEFFKKNKFDIIIGLTPRPAAMLTFIKTESKRVAWLHSTYERYFNTKNDFQWHQEMLYGNLFPLLDDIIVLTDYDKKVYSDHFDISPIRIYNPVPFETNHTSKLNSRNIVFVGRLHYDIKGLDYLVKIAEKLKQRIENIKFKIVGDGAGKDRLVSDIKKNKLDDIVELVGSTDNVQKYYEDAEICVVTSRVEGFGLVIVEAFEQGVPVVAFENAGPSEIIEDGKTGFLIPNFDIDLFALKLYELLMDDEMRKAMGKAAKNKAREFHKDVILNSWIEFLQNEVNNSEKNKP